jgi:hypothetical protein
MSCTLPAAFYELDDLGIDRGMARPNRRSAAFAGRLPFAAYTFERPTFPTNQRTRREIFSEKGAKCSGINQMLFDSFANVRQTGWVEFRGHNTN